MKPIFLFLNFERALFFNLKISILSISRDEFFKLSGFNAQFKRHQDIEFSIRASILANPYFLGLPLYIKIYSGSPSYKNVLQGKKLLLENFEELLNNLSSEQLRRFKAFNEIRLAELSFKEFKFSFFRHFIKSILSNPYVLLQRLKRYSVKLKILLLRS